MHICCHYFILLKRAYPTIDISFHPNSETITHSENIYIVLMVLSCTRIKLLCHCPLTQLSFGSACSTSLWFLEQRLPFFGQALPPIFILPEMIVATVIKWHLHKLLSHPILAVYPFRCICANYFHYQGMNYLVIVDRYSNWPIVERTQDGSKGLIEVLWWTYAIYGIPHELSFDGGLVFVSHITRSFLSDWGVHHRLSSMAFPHSNCRAEFGVKTIKWLITNIVWPNGTLNVDKFQKAILQYQNSPDKDTKLSPVMCIFGRPIKDLIPILAGKYQTHSVWQESLSAREEALMDSAY